MKSITKYCFLVVLFIGNSMFSQITYTAKTTDVTCNHTSLGKIELIISSTNAPYTFLWNDGQITPEIKNLETGSYTVKITDTFLKDSVVTFLIKEKECELEPEIIFTPNGDGINDTWSIANAQYFPNALILVYNRWGFKVYEHSGLYLSPGWDGTDLLSLDAPTATYYYVVFEDKKKEKEIIKGSVSIVR